MLRAEMHEPAANPCETLPSRRRGLGSRRCLIFAARLLLLAAPAARAQPPLEVRATSLWRGPAERPAAVLELELRRPLALPARITVRDASESVVATLRPARNTAGEIVHAALPWPGKADTFRVLVRAEEADGATAIRASVPRPETGWVLHLVPGFHFDPVWWNTQANYTEAGARMGTDVAPGHTLVGEYMEACSNDPRLRVALHDLPYLKTFLEARPWARAELERLVRRGQVALVGGTYDEVSSTLVSAEAIARNAIYGSLFQRRVLPGTGRVFWQCDVFGHDPGFPSLMAGSGHTGGAFARGPFHQWGAARQQVNFPSEFAWTGPDGRSILTHYMTGHYGYGYGKLTAAAVSFATASGSAASFATASDSMAGLADWEAAVAGVFEDLRRPALTHHVLVPLQADFARPIPGLAALVEAWNDRYLSPQVEISTPDRFFAAVRAEVELRHLAVPVVTRDMNPIYTGCPVSFADLKTAERECETVLRDAEILATLASLEGARFPHVSLDRAWRQLLFAAHHDAVTGSMSDQVYVDILYGYRDALDLAAAVRERALAYLSERAGGASPALVWSTVASPRDGVSGVGCAPRRGLAARAAQAEMPAMPVGPLVAIENEYLAARIDLEHGGALAGLRDKEAGRELLRGFGNQIACVTEYRELPGHGEGPWHLAPTGEERPGTTARARLVEYASQPVPRVVVEVSLPEYVQRQTYMLPPGSRQLEMLTEIRAWRTSDRLLRVEFPLDLPGARPVHATATAAIGRPFARNVDTAKEAWTLDQACGQWVDLGTTCVLQVQRGTDVVHRRALGVAEIVVPEGARRTLLEDAGSLARAFARCGVTSSITRLDDRRYGDLEYDSNQPDFRVAFGDPGLLLPALGAPAGPVARVGYWEPAGDTLLPVLSIPDAACLAEVVRGLEAEAMVRVQAADARVTERRFVADYGVALFNRGSVSVHVSPGGALGLNLMRSCTGWPAGVWIDGPTRRLPDGEAFATMHGTHRFEYALRPHAGDWRQAELARWAHEYNQPPLEWRRADSASPGDAASRDEPGFGEECSFVVIEPPGVQLVAMKPAGFPLATWDLRGMVERAPRLVALRLWNGTGRRTEARLRLRHLAGSAHRADLLEQRGARLPVRDGVVRVELEPHAFETVLCEVRERPRRQARSAERPALEAALVRDHAAAEPSAPWLENRGEGTSANGILGLAPEQRRVELVRGVGGVRVHVTNHDRRQRVEVELELEADPRLRARLERTRLQLAAGESRAVLVVVEGPPHAADSRSAITLRASRSGLPAVTTSIWVEPKGEPSGPPIEVRTETALVGPNGTLRAVIENHSDGPLAGEAAWLAPQAVWPLLGPWRQAIRIPARGEVAVECPLGGAIDSWALLRFTAAGRVAYGAPVALVSDPSGVLLRPALERVRVRAGSAVSFEVEAMSLAGLAADSPIRVPSLPHWSIEEAGRRFTAVAGTSQLTVRYTAMPGPQARDTTLAIRGPKNSETRCGLAVVAVQRARPLLGDVTVDGDFDEWQEREFTSAHGPRGRMRGAVRWGEAGLAFAFAVEDSQHVQPHGDGGLWQGDSVQMGLTLAPVDAIGYDARVLEYGAALSPAGPLAWCYYGGEGGRTGRLPEARAAVGSGGRGWTLYEIFLPRPVLGGLPLQPGAVLGFSYLANDDDGAGWQGAVQWTRGMSGGKDASLFGDLVLEKE